MTGRFVIALALLLTLQAQDDPWARVRQLVSGVDLRVTTDGEKPVMVKLDELRDDVLVVIRKNEQSAIPRSAIVKIELRMPDAKSRAQASTKTEYPQAADGRVSKTTTGGVTLRSREGDFVLVYRRGDPPGK